MKKNSIVLTKTRGVLAGTPAMRTKTALSLAAALALVAVLAGCPPVAGPDGPSGSEDVAVSFTSLTAVGSPTNKVTLVFDQDITGLAVGDITVTLGSTGATKGGLTKTAGATGKYELALSGVTTTGEITVAVSKGGYAITPSSKKVTVYRAEDAPFVAVTGIGGVPSAAEVNTPLTLTGTVEPEDATNQTITWTVKAAGTTGAAISGGKLTATATGTVTVTATIANGTNLNTDYTQDFSITVSAASGTSREDALTLTLGAELREGGITAGGEKWYKFTAESGTTYSVQWADSLWGPSGSYTLLSAYVSAFRSDGTSISSFQNALNGYATPKTLSGVSGTVYLKVEGSSATSSGTFAIRVFNPSALPPQTVMTISTISATPVPTVVISWNSATGVTGYRVYRSTAGETGEYEKVEPDITGSTTTRYTDTAVSAGSTYWYKVAAYNANGEGEKSPAKSSGVVPGAGGITTLTPGDPLTSGSITAGGVQWYQFAATSGTTYSVQWADRAYGPSGNSYTLVMSKVSAFNSDGTPISGFQGSTSGYTAPETLSGVSGTVYLKVEGYGATYAGSFAIRVFDPSTLPPQNVMTIQTISATPAGTVVISWNYASGVSGYRVYRSTSETGTYTQVGTDITSVYESQYTDTSVSAGSTYWYKVAAYNANGEGEKSPAKSSGVVPAAGDVTELTLGAALTSGSITAGGVKWYKFTATSGTTYSVQWADKNYGPSSGNTYTLGISKVSAFNSDGTPISLFQDRTNGYTTPKTLSVVSGTTVYLKVEGYSATYAGTFAIRVYQ